MGVGVTMLLCLILLILSKTMTFILTVSFLYLHPTSCLCLKSTKLFLWLNTTNTYRGSYIISMRRRKQWSITVLMQRKRSSGLYERVGTNELHVHLSRGVSGVIVLFENK